LANLFDVGLVFAVALLLALVTALNVNELLADTDLTIVKNPAAPDMEILIKKGERLERYRMSQDEAGGDGKRLGICYRLKSGEVIYVPESTTASKK